MSAAATVVGVADLAAAELYELVYQLKQCNESAPEETRRLLQEQPEFARALAQAQLKLGMVVERREAAAPVNAVVRARERPRLRLFENDVDAQSLIECSAGRVHRPTREARPGAAGAARAGAEPRAGGHPVAAAGRAPPDHGAAGGHGAAARVASWMVIYLTPSSRTQGDHDTHTTQQIGYSGAPMCAGCGGHERELIRTSCRCLHFLMARELRT